LINGEVFKGKLAQGNLDIVMARNGNNFLLYLYIFIMTKLCLIFFHTNKKK